MPPRYSYWTIIVDGGPTAFRAAEREELLPTLKQLQAKSPTAELKWFARGRLWPSPDAAKQDLDETRARHRRARHPSGERRGPEWRPGGKHVDPRAKYDPKRRETLKRDAARARANPPATEAPPPDRQPPLRPPSKPWERDRPSAARKPWERGRPPGARKPWERDRPEGRGPDARDNRGGRPPGKPGGGDNRGGRPTGRPTAGAPKPWERDRRPPRGGKGPGRGRKN